MARMRSLEVQQSSAAGAVVANMEPAATVSAVNKGTSGGGGGGDKPPTSRKVSFRVRGAGRRRREGRGGSGGVGGGVVLRQSTVASLTSKFNALTEPQRLLLQREEQKARHGGRYSVQVIGSAAAAAAAANHPALVARLSAGSASSGGGVKAAIQIFERNSVTGGGGRSARPTSEPVVSLHNLKNISHVLASAKIVPSKKMVEYRSISTKEITINSTSPRGSLENVTSTCKAVLTPLVESLEKEDPPNSSSAVSEVKSLRRSFFTLPLVTRPPSEVTKMPSEDVKPTSQIIKSASSEVVKSLSEVIIKPVSGGTKSQSKVIKTPSQAIKVNDLTTKPSPRLPSTDMSDFFAKILDANPAIHPSAKVLTALRPVSPKSKRSSLPSLRQLVKPELPVKNIPAGRVLMRQSIQAPEVRPTAAAMVNTETKSANPLSAGGGGSVSNIVREIQGQLRLKLAHRTDDTTAPYTVGDTHSSSHVKPPAPLSNTLAPLSSNLAPLSNTPAPLSNTPESEMSSLDTKISPSAHQVNGSELHTVAITSKLSLPCQQSRPYSSAGVEEEEGRKLEDVPSVEEVPAVPQKNVSPNAPSLPIRNIPPVDTPPSLPLRDSVQEAPAVPAREVPLPARNVPGKSMAASAENLVPLRPVPPNESFLWSSGAAKNVNKTPQHVEEALAIEDTDENYDDIYMSAPAPGAPGVPRYSYAAMQGQGGSHHDPGGGMQEYEYCLGGRTSASYDDCVGESNLLYDDIKSLAAASNCYESIGGGSRAPSYCEKNNSLYGGLPEDRTGLSPFSSPASSSSTSLDSASPGGGSRSSIISAEDGTPHEVLSYQLIADFTAGQGHVQGQGSGERPSETSDDWVDIELSESEETMGRSETIVILRDRSRTRRSPSWSHKVRRQWSRSPKKRMSSNRVFVTSASVLHLVGAGNGPRGPRRSAPPPPVRRLPNLVGLRVRVVVNSFRESQELVTFFFDKEGTDGSSSSDPENHYETLYEVVGNVPSAPTPAEVPIPVAAPVVPAPMLPHAPHEENGMDSGDLTDSSFDSDDSSEFQSAPASTPSFPLTTAATDVPVILPELPPPPPGHHGGSQITKIAEAANKKMKKLHKNWTLRKQSLGERLRRMSLTSPPTQHLSAAPEPPLKVPPPQPVQPPPLPPLPPAAAPSLLEKSVSASSLSGRKYWSFKGKFNRQTSSPSIKGGGGGARENSIFYVSQDALNNETPAPDSSLPDRNHPTRRSATESVCSSGRGSSAGSEGDVPPRRLSKTAVRPRTPPPPPPPEGSARNGKGSVAPWYADIELSSLELPGHRSPGHGGSAENVEGKNGHATARDSSWYSETGLDSSIGDSSNMTASSESSSASPEGSVVGCFADEPLYQFYAASVLEEAKRELVAESDSDGYEEIGEGGLRLVSRPSAMELIRPREGHRKLWCEVPDVIESGMLDTLNQQQRKLQEAKFELITSEASYVKSLAILASHFVNCPDFQDESVISKSDKHILFSNILPVKACSERMLADLERCWQENIMLHDICDVVYRHATRHFRVYVKYCAHQIYLDRTLRRLKEGSSLFSEALARLETAPECQSLSLHSFLMLPMQRVTRLPLLLDAILRRLAARDPEFDACKLALAALNKVVQECNEGARCMERMEEMLLLSQQLEFPREVRAVPLISSARWLVRSGELTQLTCRDEAKLTFGRRFGKVPVCVFLFTDLLVVAKRRGEESFLVLDHCPRNLVQVSSPEDAGEGALTQLPVRLSSGEGGKNLLLLTLLQNHENKTVEMVLSCGLESDRQRWLAAFLPPVAPENPEERVYEEWDCPQVQVVHSYASRQPDELSLEAGEVVNVLRKLPDGWYQGERIRDGERGWFPGNYCKEVLSQHVRARNLRQRYRLLALSRDYIDAQRKANSSGESTGKARRSTRHSKT